MYIYIRTMPAQHNKIILLEIMVPLLPGSVTTAMSTCGKPHCACKSKRPKLHGLYYRWTGFIQGQRTTKTISKEVAQECQRRIKNYRRLQQQIEKLLAQALAQAPWKREKE